MAVGSTIKRSVIQLRIGVIVKLLPAVTHISHFRWTSLSPSKTRAAAKCFLTGEPPYPPYTFQKSKTFGKPPKIPLLSCLCTPVMILEDILPVERSESSVIALSKCPVQVRGIIQTKGIKRCQGGGTHPRDIRQVEMSQKT